MKLLPILALLAAPLAAQPADGEMRWLPVTSPELEVNGLPWFGENHGDLIRLPLRIEAKVPPAVWNLAKSPSGARIRLRTDSRTVVVRLEYPSAPNMSNMHAFGQTGVDLYTDGVYTTTVVADKDAAPGKIYEKRLYEFRDQPRTARNLTLYLSLYKPVKVLGIGVEADSRVLGAPAYAAPKPVVFYGTSITQGGCASRSGLSYQAILGRMLNVDFVNLGFSGNGKGEAELARAVADIDASAYVLDFAQNNGTVASLEQVYAPFLQIVRERRPDVPIVAITPIYNTREPAMGAAKGETQKMRDHIRQVVARRIADGDTRLQIVEGTDLLGPAQGDGLVDGTHPNDLGFQWMAEGLAGRLRKMLGLR
jgi:lysophospholipase L1-like esterase